MKEYTLPKEFALRWTTALRSGDYAQTKGILYRSPEHSLNYDPDYQEGYCGLGVAGSICGLSNDYLKFKGGIPIGEERVPIELIDSPLANKCARLNDHNRLTFPQIADWLDENVEYYE